MNVAPTRKRLDGNAVAVLTMPLSEAEYRKLLSATVPFDIPKQPSSGADWKELHCELSSYTYSGFLA